MHSRRVPWWPRAVLLGAVAVTALAAGCGGSAPKPTKRATVSVPSSVKSLTVRGRVGRVRVSAREGASKITVVQTRTSDAEPRNAIGRSSATLKYDCPGDSSRCRVDYTITAPPKVSVDIDNTAGTVTLSGPLTDVVAKAEAGAVTGRGLGAGSFKVTTTVGEVDLAFAGVPTFVKTATTVGDTTIRVPAAGTYQVKASTGVGGKSVNVPNDPNAKNHIEAKTETGGLTIGKD
jgi:hypothetical protein